MAFALAASLACGCEQITTKTDINGNPLTELPPNGVTSNTTGRIDPNCMSGNYDACIIYQNPVAQRGSIFPAPVTETTDLTSVQTYAVPIAGIDNSGFLQNASYAILPQSVPRITRNNDGKWRYPYSICSGASCAADAAHHVSQLMAYYWLDQQMSYMTQDTGTWYATRKGIAVDPYVPGLDNAFWDSSTISISLGDHNNQDFAISAEVYLHENGHANVHYASMGNIEGATSNEVGCGTGGVNNCCTALTGCSGSINEGLADFHAGIMFPGDTALGETLVNATGGFIECGLPRDIALNVNLTATQAFNACGGGVNGEIHVLGRVYASIWWQLRIGASKAADIETLFTEHLRGLAASDTYETAGGKIIALDNALFAGAHATAIRAEFIRRGITPK
jgi:hypothetical protein